MTTDLTPPDLKQELMDALNEIVALTQERNKIRETLNMSSTDEENRLREQLAASQEREAKLRDDFRIVLTHIAKDYAWPAIEAALTLPTDTSALQARLADEREKVCALDCLNDYMRERIRSMK